MSRPLVKIGFVPSYRHYGDMSIPDWCAKMRADALAAFQGVPGMQVVVPTPSPVDPGGMDAEKGYVPDGAVWSLDQAEVVAEFFAREKVDGIIIAALDFGDERSSAKVAEKLRVPGSAVCHERAACSARAKPGARFGFVLRDTLHRFRAVPPETFLPLCRDFLRRGAAILPAKWKSSSVPSPW